jgi:rhodanese-related sulfurtransferase
MREIVLACALVACSRHAPAPATVTVDQVAQALARGEVQPVDANGQATRAHEGVLPGAILLSDAETFVLSELPADKARPLVFYCTNVDCSSSHHAAQKAIVGGYEHVEVMPDGIAGWIQAGKQTRSVNGSSS